MSEMRSGEAMAELVRAALSAAERGDEDERWRTVERLRAGGGREALQAATRLCGSRDARHRELGVDILAQLGASDGVPARRGPFRDEAMAVLLGLVDAERDPAVLRAIGIAFAHLGDERAVAPLARLRAHADPEVRHAVAFGLLNRAEPAALDVLIELSADPEPEVRDWAAYGLGRGTDADGDRLRGALVARLTDPDHDARAEAIVGLARRNDPRAVPALLDALAGPWPGSDPYLIEQALYALAATTDDARLCGHVAAHRDDWLVRYPDQELPDDLQRAVDRCAQRGTASEA